MLRPLSSPRRAPWGLAALAATGVACSERLPAGPDPQSVRPPQGVGDRPVRVEIAGNGFIARPRAAFDDPASSALVVGFRAWLGEDELEEVRLTPAETITALVPAGLARGVHDLTVWDPYGRTGVKKEAYRVVTSAENVGAFLFDLIRPQVARVQFTVRLTAVDSVGLPVEGFAGTVALSDRTGTLAPVRAGPFELGKLRVAVLIVQITPANTLTAKDDLGNTGTSNEFAVQAGPPVKLVFPGPPQTVVAGQCSSKVSVELRDTNDLPARAVDPVSVGMVAGPADRFTLHADGACGSPITHLGIQPGESTGGFHFRGEVAGSVVIRATPDVVPGASQPQTITPGSPERVAFAGVPASLTQGTCVGQAAVETRDGFANASPAGAAVTVDLAAEPAGAVAFFSEGLCSAARTAAAVAAGQSAVPIWIRGVTPGTVVIRATPVSPSTLQSDARSVTVSP